MITCMPDSRNAKIVFCTNVSEEMKKQVEDIMKESQNPYESFVDMFGHEKFHYMPSTNTFYFVNEEENEDDSTTI